MLSYLALGRFWVSSNVFNTHIFYPKLETQWKRQKFSRNPRKGEGKLPFKYKSRVAIPVFQGLTVGHKCTGKWQKNYLFIKQCQITFFFQYNLHFEQANQVIPSIWYKEDWIIKVVNFSQKYKEAFEKQSPKNTEQNIFIQTYPSSCCISMGKEYYPSSSIRKGAGREKEKERDLSNKSTLSESLPR